MSEFQMDNTLNAACFLNDGGDLIASFKNHIFFIDRTKGERVKKPYAINPSVVLSLKCYAFDQIISISVRNWAKYGIIIIFPM